MNITKLRLSSSNPAAQCVLLCTLDILSGLDLDLYLGLLDLGPELHLIGFVLGLI